jgi:hypothetical protein
MKLRFRSILLLVISLSLCSTTLVAGEMTEQDILLAVETWVRSATADARPEASVAQMQPYLVDGVTMAYIAHLSGGGFCLCGADDRLLPVYYYSPKGRYRPDHPGYRIILQEIGARVEVLRPGIEKTSRTDRAGDLPRSLQDRATLWQDLMAGRKPRKMKTASAASKEEPLSMILDFTSHWHQQSPYNDQCPQLDPGRDEHALVGPDATALAQIMYYWQWPSSGQGSNSVVYTYWYSAGWIEKDCDTDPGIPPDSIWEERLEWQPDDKDNSLRMKGYWDSSLFVEANEISDHPDYQTALGQCWAEMTSGPPVSVACAADFEATTYDWNQMEDVHSDPPDAGAAEAAELCYHLGVSLGKDYGVGSSPAIIMQMDNALRNNFAYDPDARLENRDIDAITEDIQWQRPVVLTGMDPPSNEHVWVVYGYNKATDPDRQFLVNMGWGGEDDGWYTCDGMGYGLFQKQAFHISPADVVKYVGGGIPGDGSPADPYADVETAAAHAPDSTTLIFRAGSQMSFSGDSLVIDRPMVLKGKTVIGE